MWRWNVFNHTWFAAMRFQTTFSQFELPKHTTVSRWCVTPSFTQKHAVPPAFLIAKQQEPTIVVAILAEKKTVKSSHHGPCTHEDSSSINCGPSTPMMFPSKTHDCKRSKPKTCHKWITGHMHTTKVTKVDLEEKQLNGVEWRHA